jgi:hypothetical protein
MDLDETQINIDPVSTLPARAAPICRNLPLVNPTIFIIHLTGTLVS